MKKIKVRDFRAEKDDLDMYPTHLWAENLTIFSLLFWKINDFINSF